jgi:biotin transport system substrate-specific component
MTSSVSVAEMRRLVRLAVWASLIALGAWVALPVGPVPVTLQTFFLFLAAFMEGPVACLAAVLYVLAGLVGLPVFTGGRVGPALLFGPTAGFALAFPLMVALAGLARKKVKPLFSRFLAFGLLGLAVLYLGGVIGLILNLNMTITGAIYLSLSFLPGDLTKLFCAALVAQKASKRRGVRSKLAVKSQQEES